MVAKTQFPSCSVPLFSSLPAMLFQAPQAFVGSRKHRESELPDFFSNLSSAVHWLCDLGKRAYLLFSFLNIIQGCCGGSMG